MDEIRIIHTRSWTTYGSPISHPGLVASGFHAGKNRVARLMQAKDSRAQRKEKRKRTPVSKHKYPIAPNWLNRDFQAEAPHQKWLGNITFTPTREGWLYLAAILDLFSRKVVGWALEDTLGSSLVEQAFHKEVQNRKQVDCLLHHTDRGSQYVDGSYRGCWLLITCRSA